MKIDKKIQKYRNLVVGIFILVFGGIIYLHISDSADISVPAELLDGEVVVVLTSQGYEPSDLTIPVGTKVTFTAMTGKPHWPASNLHPTHEQYPEFDPQRPLEPEESWSFVFDKPGRWDFHDHIRSYFAGTIYVTN
jgi:plastocyanin